MFSCSFFAKALILIVLTTILTTPQSLAEQSKTKKITGVANFFDRTATGDLAFLPKVTSATRIARPTFYDWFSEDNNAYRMKRRTGRHWFFVNHRSPKNPKHTYLGVQIILIYDYEFADPVYLYRNEGWFSDNPNNCNGEFEDTVDSLSIERFYTIHSGRNLSDDAIEKWHATPCQSLIHSWKERRKWSPGIILTSSEFSDKFEPSLPDDYKLALQTRLIKYERTKRRIPDKPLDFFFTPGAAIAAYIRLFSPDDPDFTRNYFIRYE